AAGMSYLLYARQDPTRPLFPYSTLFRSNAVGSAALPLNVWSYLAATFDGGSLRLYVNGALAATKAVSGAIPTSTGDLRIGGNSVDRERTRRKSGHLGISDGAFCLEQIKN